MAAMAAATPEPVDQLVYLSNRPEILAETLGYARHFMPWVAEIVVMGPRETNDRLRKLDIDAPRLVLVNEDDLLTSSENNQIPTAHSARNATLRRILYERGPIADVFLQSDDDYRPLRPIEPSVFVDDGRLVSYACHDLAMWRRDESDYDRVQHASYLALSYFDAGHLNFASHMPQAIDRALFAESFGAAMKLDPDGAFCEWSLPLNHGRRIAPERFAPPRTYRTMCWPRYPHEWPYWRRPERIAFENFHPELYAPRGLFAGLPTALDTEQPERQAFEKLQRWYRFDLEMGRLRFRGGVRDPWRFGRTLPSTVARHAFFRTASALRRMWEYVALEERTELSELAGRLASSELDDTRPHVDETARHDGAGPSS